MRLVDSHCHLQADRFDADIDQVIGAARLAGVERILVPGWDLESSRGALELVDRFPWLHASVGVHPHDAERVDDAEWIAVAALASDDRVVATGETGLDYDRLFSSVPAQLGNLRRNLTARRGDRQAGDPALPIGCGPARRPGLAARGAPGVRGDAAPPVVIHSFGPGRLRRGDARPRRCDLILRAFVPHRRGGNRRGGPVGRRPTGSSSRPTRRSSHRPAPRAAATSPSGSGSRPPGSPSSAARTATPSATSSSRTTTRSSRAPQGRARVDRPHRYGLQLALSH